MERRSFVASLLGLAILPRFANQILPLRLLSVVDPTTYTTISVRRAPPIAFDNVIFLTHDTELIRVTAMDLYNRRLTIERGL